MTRKDFYSDMYYLEWLCMKYNHFTKPYIHRTDHEHYRSVSIARECLRRIKAKYRYGIDYRELCNGALLPYYNS